MERTEQMYTIQKQMDFGKIKVRFVSAQTPSRKVSTEFTGLDLLGLMTAVDVDGKKPGT